MSFVKEYHMRGISRLVDSYDNDWVIDALSILDQLKESGSVMGGYNTSLGHYCPVCGDTGEYESYFEEIPIKVLKNKCDNCNIPLHWSQLELDLRTGKVTKEELYND